MPYGRFLKSLKNSFSIGMRFKTHVEGEDAADKRLGTLITDGRNLILLPQTGFIFLFFFDFQSLTLMDPIFSFSIRHTGLITGVGDRDPSRWPGSKWKCLLVYSLRHVLLLLVVSL